MCVITIENSSTCTTSVTFVSVWSGAAISSGVAELGLNLAVTGT
jgi:hypothetical protein